MHPSYLAENQTRHAKVFAEHPSDGKQCTSAVFTMVPGLCTLECIEIPSGLKVYVDSVSL